jgi:bacterial/archaeal transporter family-2 protein
MILWLCMLTALAGALTPVQSGANATLGKLLGNALGPVLITLSISLAFAAVAGIFARVDTASFGRLAQAPWWAWVGGFCGAVFLLSQPIAAPRLGAAVYIGITVTASAVASLALDHFGLFGFAQQSASIGRIAGAALMIAGVAMIAKF